MSGDLLYAAIGGEKELAHHRELQRRLRVIEKEEEKRMSITKGKSQVEIENEEIEGPPVKKSRVYHDGEMKDTATDISSSRSIIDCLLLQPLSEISFVPVPMLAVFLNGSQQPPTEQQPNHHSLILRLYGAPGPSKSPFPSNTPPPPLPPKVLTHIPTTPPPSNRPEPHAPPGTCPFVPLDAVRNAITRRFPCVWINCNKDYGSIERANRHIKSTHLKGRNWVCQQCGHFSCAEEEKLTDHLRNLGQKDDRWPGFEFWKWV